MFKRKRRRSREFKKSNKIIDFNEVRAERQKKRQSATKKEAESMSDKSIASRRKEAKKNRRRAVYTVIILTIITVIGLSIYDVISLHMERKQVLAENARLQAKKERLIEEFKNVDNPEYIEQQARMQLQLIMPGEIRFILPKEDQTDKVDQTAVEGEATNEGN